MARELEERLVSLAISNVRMTEKMPRSPAGKYYGDQLLRSSGSCALNYAESQNGASHRDFTHKLKIVLKELGESQTCLKIIKGASIHADPDLVAKTLSETSELLAIFTTAVKTAEKRSPRK